MASLSITCFFVKGGRGALQLFLSQKGNHDKHNRWIMRLRHFRAFIRRVRWGFIFLDKDNAQSLYSKTFYVELGEIP